MNKKQKGLLEQIQKNKKMNIVFKGIVVFLVLILFTAFGLSMIYSNIFEKDFYKDSKNNMQNKNYEYNYQVVMYQTSEDFLNKFKKGLYDAAESNQVFIDFVNTQSIDQAIDNINIAVAAKVDGIIAQGIYDVDYIAAINKAIEKGIPVAFVYTDARGTDRSYFLGFNAYDLGKKAARLTAEGLEQKNAEIALLVQSFSENEKDITSSLIIEGFKDIIDKYQNIKIVNITKTNHDLFSAEDITYEILKEYPEIDGIICTSEKDTFGAAQVIIDLNKVGKIKLIGAGVSEEIIKYIELQVIEASFDMKPEKMGQKCIETMRQKTNETDFIEIPFATVTSDNVAKYK